MLNFIVKEMPDGRFKIIGRTVYKGKVYGTHTFLNHDSKKIILDAISIMYDELQDTLEVLREQENESSGNSERG